MSVEHGDRGFSVELHRRYNEVYTEMLKAQEAAMKERSPVSKRLARRHRWSYRVHRLRERAALRFAPWLCEEDW